MVQLGYLPDTVIQMVQVRYLPNTVIQMVQVRYIPETDTDGPSTGST